MYWDASALVPLFVVEPGSESVRTWLSEDDRIITWVWTRTEIVSAIERRTREGSLSRRQRRNVLERFNAFADSWDEVTDVLAVRARANALHRTTPAAGRGRRAISAPRFWSKNICLIHSRSSVWTGDFRPRRNRRAFA